MSIQTGRAATIRNSLIALLLLATATVVTGQRAPRRAVVELSTGLIAVGAKQTAILSLVDVSKDQKRPTFAQLRILDERGKILARAHAVLRSDESVSLELTRDMIPTADRVMVRAVVRLHGRKGMRTNPVNLTLQTIEPSGGGGSGIVYCPQTVVPFGGGVGRDDVFDCGGGCNVSITSP